MSGSAKRSHFNPRLVGLLTPTHFTTAIADPERLLGCLAMTDGKIAEIYTICQAAHKGGQPFFRIHIFPFRMTEERIAKAAESEWLRFWQNLKTSYDIFEKNKIPPNVTVKEKQYAFE